jgi:hypothetical protein
MLLAIAVRMVVAMVVMWTTVFSGIKWWWQ